MTAGAVPFSSERNIFRCVITSTVNTLAFDAQKRYENHLKWLQEKEYAMQLQKENKIKAKEVAMREKALLDEELQQRRDRNRIEVEKWQKRVKNKELIKVTNNQDVNLVKNDMTKKTNIDGKQLYENWLKSKRQKKELEKLELEVMKKREDQVKECRKALADVCYQEWKEFAGNRKIIIPKNGFQIFGPKPKPVVLEEWVTAEPPQETRSMHSIGNPRLYFIDSFRSEGHLGGNDSDRSKVVSRQKLGCSNWSLVPWSQRQGSCHLRTPQPGSKTNLTSSVRSLSANVKQVQKKKPPFR